MIQEKIKTYNGKEIIRYEQGMSIDSNLGYIIYLDYDEGNDSTITNHLKDIIDNNHVDNLNTLIIGCWAEPFEDSCQNIIDFMIDKKDYFQKLEAFFCGDMESEECEISWIIQANYEGYLACFPNLKHFGVRGGTELQLGVINHTNLKSLVLEAGGLSKEVVNSVMTANLPELETLHLWLGTDEYGGNSEINQFHKLLFGTQFPHLKHLGLMDCDYVDEIALTLKDAVILDRIETLDLSMGTLSDDGAQELFFNDNLKKLKHLNLRYHFLSDECMHKLKAKFGQLVNLVDQGEVDEYDGEIYRYVEVAE
ncbi:MAG: STM4015 family protein [Alcanivoracaceae bacterium]|nr:STM4015 family protein [Alcanivoracaceae bacterium]